MSIEDVDKFEHQLLQFQNKDFYDYFIPHYICRQEVWAFCYRKHVNIKNNIASKNMHRRIKHIYLKEKQCTQLDK